jgi:DNA polymerase III subunit gamma/tau
VRDLLVLTVDPARISDPEIAGEGERDRLVTLAARFSREDLLRAFDLLARVEYEIRGAAQPRYHLEMGLLRWMHLRKLVPIEELIQAAGARPATARPSPPGPAPRPVPGKMTGGMPAAPDAAPPSRPVSQPAAGPAAGTSAGLKETLLAEILKEKVVFYNTVVAQAQRIDATPDAVVFTFSPAQRVLLRRFEQSRSWLESVAQRIGGRPVAVSGVVGEAAAIMPDAARAADPAASKKADLRERALADESVQAMLAVFPAEIRDVEEM